MLLGVGWLPGFRDLPAFTSFSMSNSSSLSEITVCGSGLLTITLDGFLEHLSYENDNEETRQLEGESTYSCEYQAHIHRYF